MLRLGGQTARGKERGRKISSGQFGADYVLAMCFRNKYIEIVVCSELEKLLKIFKK